METLQDIQNLDDVKQLVDTFYSKVREDGLLKDIFEDVIQDRWPEHLEKMYRFWQTVLLDEHTYNGTPFIPHIKLPVEKKHFDQWLVLFFSTIDQLFKGETAERAKWQAERMATMFNTKLTYYKVNGLKPQV